MVRSAEGLDRTDLRLLMALHRSPRATVMSLAERLGLSRNTVQSHVSTLQSLDGFGPLGAGIDPAIVGYPLSAFITVTVMQRGLAEVAESLAEIPEVLEVLGVTGATDLLVRVAAVDADDLYRVAGTVLALPGIERTNTALVMRPLVEFRLEPLLQKTLWEKRNRSSRRA